MKNLLLLAIIILMQGCALTDATLKVNHDEQVNITGPMSEAEGIAFLPPQLEDARPDKARIGYKKNGFGMDMGEITSEQTVDAIIENALIDAIRDNGHSASAEGRVQIVGTVDRFWFDTDINFWTVEFIGDVQCTLDFIDTENNSSIYSSTYSGTYKDKKAAGLEKTWTEVMNQAVNKLIEDIVFDEALTEALENLQ